MSIVLVTYPKFKGWNPTTGLFANGYKIWVRKAGTVDTLTSSWSDSDCTALNSNPVVLNSVGEASIYVKEAVDLIYTIPTAVDMTTPIWTVYDYGVQTNTSIVTGASTPVTVNNNYVFDVVPVFTSIPDRLTLVMTPDLDSKDTITSQVFTGTGINDFILYGPYVGSTAGSIFTFTIDDIFTNKPDAPTAALSATAGVVTAGDHRVKVSYKTASGETNMSNASAIVAADGTHKISVTAIPVGPTGVLTKGIYMTKAGGSTYYHVADIANATTSYSINTADAALVDVGPTSNTTIDTIKWKKDGGAWTTLVSITGNTQTFIEGITGKFATIQGHTFGDTWALTVMTPARLNFCALDNVLIYKNNDGVLEALGEKDMVANIPATLVYSGSQNCWILNNPSLPAIPDTVPQRVRKNLAGNYVLSLTDQGKELCFTTAATLTLLSCSAAANTFYYVTNKSTGMVTINVAGGTDLIYPAGDSTGVTSYILGPDTIQINTDGASWHQLTTGAAIPVGTVMVYPNPIGYATCTAVLSGTVGVVDNGDHSVRLTAVTALGETAVIGGSGVVTVALNKKIDVSGIPLPSGHITGYKIYMTKAGGTDNYYVADATGATYTINTADADLTVLAPTDTLLLPAPPGFLYTDGSAISRTLYSRLFAFLGTIWGVGDGTTTFNIPNYLIDPGATGVSSALTIIKY